MAVFHQYRPQVPTFSQALKAGRRRRSASHIDHSAFDHAPAVKYSSPLFGGQFDNMDSALSALQ